MCVAHLGLVGQPNIDRVCCYGDVSDGGICDDGVGTGCSRVCGERCCVFFFVIKGNVYGEEVVECLVTLCLIIVLAFVGTTVPRSYAVRCMFLWFPPIVLVAVAS